MKSTDIIQPQAMDTIFAKDVYSSSGTTDFEIPAATSTLATDTCVIDNGFLPITSEPLPTPEEPDNPGIAPERKNFNGLFYLSTDQRVFLQNGGYITYNTTVAAKIGGYPKGAILGFVNNNFYGFVESLIDDNQINFVADTSKIDGINWRYIPIANVIETLKLIYPVDSIYIGVMSACPLASFFGTWTKIASNMCLQGSSYLHSAGTTIAAGLPDIWGEFPIDNKSWVDGAITTSGSNSKGATGESGLQYHAYFYASDANSIYGSSHTVQPPAYVVNVWRRTA